MRSVAEARSLILNQVTPAPEEQVRLESALHRILAADLTVTQDSPPFDKALMDGFAVQSGMSPAASADGDRIMLKVLETITAGQRPVHPLGSDTCSRIMTGAPLPDGCDCVVPIENTLFDEQHPETVLIPHALLRPEANLIRQGTAARCGSALLSRGTCLQPQQIAALAEFGIASVAVHRSARVAVLATGDELVPFDQPVSFGQIRNSNEPMLLAQIACCRATPVSLGIASDDADVLNEAIRLGLQHDVLLLTGGVSAGLLDLVPQQLRNAGVREVFHGVNLKPGKPLWFGTRDVNGQRCLVFGLPGNPVSSLTCFELFVRPAIDALHGLSVSEGDRVARLTEDTTARGNRPVYHPARIEHSEGQLTVRVIPWSGSSDLRATVEANGMVLLESEHGPYSAGDLVPVYFWNHPT